MSREQGYFEEALSNFMFDMASGGAIRHLADKGYSVDQIIKMLEFPTPRDRVEKTVYQHMIETGILRTVCEEEDMIVQKVKKAKAYQLQELLSKHIERNGEENSYMQCPFGEWMKNDIERLKKEIACLTSREQEYIMGIRWERNRMYHRLNSRMLEIGIQLAEKAEFDARFYFLKENLIICI